MAVSPVGKKQVRVLIADASSFVRLVLCDIFSAVPEVGVADTAIDGDEVLKKLKLLKPDVLLIDLDLPQNSRWFTLKRVASEFPVPVLAMQSETRELSAAEKNQLKKLGVYGFIRKPDNGFMHRLRSVKEEIVQKLVQYKILSASGAAQTVTANLQRPVLPSSEPKMVQHPVRVVVIGASTGGTQQIEMLLGRLQPGYKGAILVAVHLSDTFVRTFVKRLKTISRLKVSLARSGMLVEAGAVIVAPGGRDMYVQEAPNRPGMASIKLTDKSQSYYDSPSVDRLMTSVATIFTSTTTGIILTGMGTDGTKGLGAIENAGGTTIVQNQQGLGVFGMAKSALNHGVAQHVLTVQQMASFIELEALADTRNFTRNKAAGQ